MLLEWRYRKNKYYYYFVRLPKTPLLTGCATELHELMHQIDVMIEQKRTAWERERAALLAKNESKKQELATTKATLQSKQQEVGNTYIRCAFVIAP